MLQRRRNAWLVTLSLVVVVSLCLVAIVGRGHWPWASLRPAISTASAAPHLNSADFKRDLIYQVIVDRFFDGNPANDDPPGDTGLADPTHTNWQLYWGGDLAGLTSKLVYLAGMGVSALWISPIAENIHTPIGNPPSAGFHGYWARDMYRVDPHLGTWADVDTLVATAHRLGIKIIIDFAPNHSNANDAGDLGAIYRDGVLQATYPTDNGTWFHHNGGIQNFDDLYQDEYDNLADLADLAQEHPVVDAYLRGAMAVLLAHGVDGFRIDAAKHMPAGWLRTLADEVDASGPHYLVGEWFLNSVSDSTYGAATTFTNQSGIATLNFPLNAALRSVFAQGGSARQIDAVLAREGQDFTWLNDQAIFFDNHDMPRFGTLNADPAALHRALVALLTLPGIPILYYGTEQYLHNDTNGGNDPYNRPMMNTFDTSSPAYQLIKQLTSLRNTNPALGYGTYRQRWLNDDVLIYERQFFGNIALVAINTSTSHDVPITGLFTNLPQGEYANALSGSLPGLGATLSLNIGANGAAQPFTLAHGQAAIWQISPTSAPALPEIGSVGPELVRPGKTAVINGQGFGTSGTVRFGSALATIQRWSPDAITVTVPQTPGSTIPVQVCTATCSNADAINVASGAQVPVTFTVQQAPPTHVGDQVYLAGSPAELGAWNATPGHAAGPFFAPHYPDWFQVVAVPACATIQFKFLIMHPDGSVQWEGGPNHQATLACAGPSTITVAWQSG